MVSSMKKDTGRCAVVLPQGVLFRGGKEADMRRQLIESDKLECVITLVSGVFYSTGVSACILLLNNHKEAAHKGKICLVDGSKFYTPKRAQVLMTEEDIDKVFKIYQSYSDEVEVSKVITIEDAKKNGYTLALNNYIEKKKTEPATPEEIRRQYFDAFSKTIEAENKMRKLLLEGGYIKNEQ